MPVPMEERRKYVRLNTLVDVAYQKHQPEVEKELSLSKNISKGGICLIAYEKLKKFDLLDLKLYLPGARAPINAVGKVVWTEEFIIGDISTGRRFDVGIEFMKISPEDKKKIDQYVFGHL